MKSTSLTRRLLASAAGLTIAAAGVLGFAAPAQATDYETQGWVASSVEFEDTCEGTTVTTTSGSVLPLYKWTISYGEEEVNFELPAGEVDWNTEPIPTDAGEITVTFENAPPGGDWPKTHTWVEPEEGCEDPEPEPEPDPEPELKGFVNAEFDCENIFLTIENDSEVEVTLSVVPSEGDAVEVTVAAGETSDEVSFPIEAGLTVDVQSEGESVLEDGPFEVTEEDLAECPDDGEGGELPATGSSTTLIALAAAALLAVGGGMFLIARRRRIRFTA